jgi:hypothetical protein
MNTQADVVFRSAVLAAMLLVGAATIAAAQQPAAPPPQSPADQGPAPAAPDPATAQPETFDGFKVGGYTFKPGGRVKLDVIHDFWPIASEDSFDPREIPVDDSRHTNSNVHAKETRLSLDVRGLADNRELRLYLETDFYGTSSALRLRHAYGSYGGLLAGQTWTTFMDDDNLPRTIDFEAPMAFAQIRQAQVRWTQSFGAMTWSAALEDNKSTIVLPPFPGEAEYPTPDVVTRLRFDVPRGHITTSGFVGTAAFRPVVGELATVHLWGSMLSMKFDTFGRDYIYGVFTYGEGIGRYRGGITAVPDENGTLQPVAVGAYMAGYEHFWTDRWSTNVVYSEARTQEEPYYEPGFNKQLNYGAVNLLFWFIRDRAWTGVEYIYGRREVFGPGNPDGEAHRIQYAVRFNLP